MLPNTFEGSMIHTYELVPVPVPVSTGVVTTGRSRSGHRIHDEGTYSSVRGVATPRRESCASRVSTPRPARRHAGADPPRFLSVRAPDFAFRRRDGVALCRVQWCDRHACCARRCARAV